MAISGLHVGLVFMFVGFLSRILLWPFAHVFNYVPRTTLILFPALMSAALYSGLAGFAVSTQRALAMLAIYVFCRLLARDASLIKVLLIAASCVLAVDPFSVLDIGFWLSCGAVLIIALVSYSKPESQTVQKVSLIKLQPMLWIGMLPMTISFFGQISLISPLVNLIAVPLFCFLLIPLSLFGASVDVLGLEAISTVCLELLEAIFTRVYDVLLWFSQLSIAKIYITPLAWWHYALFMFSVTMYLHRTRIGLFLTGLFLLSLFAPRADSVQHDELQVVLLDVGQGLAMVIQTANTVMVYDTGPRYSSGFSAASAVLLPYLRHRGIKRIDTLLISHADNDHIGGYQTVMEAFDVGRVVTSRVDKIPTASPCRAGDHWKSDATEITILSPEEQTPQGSNNRSCVLLLEHFGTRILLSGDIEKPVENYLVAGHADKLSADLLLVPHQGSKTSSTADFLDIVAPSVAMLAAGYRNHYRHPHFSVVKRYEDRGIDLYSTIDSGSILFEIGRKGWSISQYRQAQSRFWRYQKLPQSGS